MATKKRKPQHKRARIEAKRYAGKTEKEWRDWGAEFGKGIDKGSRSLSEGMEKWNENFGRGIARHGNRWECGWKSCCYGCFGLIGPLIVSVVGTILILIGIGLLNLINTSISNAFIFMLSYFFYANIQWFFLASLFFGYSNYYSARYPRGWWLFSPIANSLRIIFVIWILVSIFNLVGMYNGVSAITMFSNFALVSLLALFSILVVIGYFFEIARKIFYVRHKK